MNNTQIAEYGNQQTAVAPQGMGQNLTLDVASMNSMVSLANIMATGKATIPQEYRNSPGDCLAVVMQAVQWGMNPFAVAQKTHFVSGKIGYEAQLVNAVITALAPTKDRLHFEWFGDWSKVIGKFDIKKNQDGKEYRQPSWTLKDEEGLGIKVWATIKGEDEPRTLELYLAQARTRNSTLWADDPRQQLAYLATKRWARLYCPDVIMGVYTPDEFEGERLERDVTPPSSGSRALDAMRSQRPAIEAEPQQPVDTGGHANHAGTYADHLSAIDSADNMDYLREVFASAWKWAESLGIEDYKIGVKELYEERKKSLAE
ncbi:RecT family recombinase [Aeromonas veronii]|uniref:RecT family recombinase n=1 Tax=Aeromonas veronii TaxID=654 RepID=UPI0038D44C66